MNNNELENTQKKFIEYMNNHNAIPDDIKWGGSLNKFNNLKNFLQSLRIISKINGKIILFGDVKLNQKIIQYSISDIINNYSENKKFIEIDLFLKYFNDNIFFIVDNRKVSKPIGYLLLSLNNKYFRLKQPTGEESRYLFPNDKNYSKLEVLSKWD